MNDLFFAIKNKKRLARTKTIPASLIYLMKSCFAG